MIPYNMFNKNLNSAELQSRMLQEKYDMIPNVTMPNPGTDKKLVPPKKNPIQINQIQYSKQNKGPSTSAPAIKESQLHAILEGIQDVCRERGVDPIKLVKQDGFTKEALEMPEFLQGENGQRIIAAIIMSLLGGSISGGLGGGFAPGALGMGGLGYFLAPILMKAFSGNNETNSTNQERADKIIPRQAETFEGQYGISPTKDTNEIVENLKEKIKGELPVSKVAPTLTGPDVSSFYGGRSTSEYIPKVEPSNWYWYQPGVLPSIVTEPGTISSRIKPYQSDIETNYPGKDTSYKALKSEMAMEQNRQQIIEEELALKKQFEEQQSKDIQKWKLEKFPAMVAYFKEKGTWNESTPTPQNWEELTTTSEFSFPFTPSQVTEFSRKFGVPKTQFGSTYNKETQKFDITPGFLKSTIGEAPWKKTPYKQKYPVDLSGQHDWLPTEKLAPETQFLKERRLSEQPK